MAYKANKHKNPVAGVYMITNNTNGKRYIGESVDLVAREWKYKGAYRLDPNNRSYKSYTTRIERDIHALGYENFTFTPLVTSNEDPMLKDTEYRRKCETQYIKKYHTLVSDGGYNTILENRTAINGRRSYTISVKDMISQYKPLLAWNIATDEVTMYMSGTSYCKLNGYKGDSIAATTLNRGQPIHGELLFYLGFTKRMEVATKFMKKWIEKRELYQRLFDERGTKGYRGCIMKADKIIARYIKGLTRINEWCIDWGFATIDIDIVCEYYLSNQ